MSDYLGIIGEYPMQCPYNPAHYMITDEEMKSHLETCRDTYIRSLTAEGRAEDVDLRVCSINPAHEIPEVELDMHEMLCENSLPVPMPEEAEEVSRQSNDEESVEGRLEGAASEAGAGEENKHVRNGTGNWVEFAMNFEGNAIGSDEGKAAFEKWKKEFWGEGYANVEKQLVQDKEEEEDDDVSSGLSEEDFEEIFADFEKNQENYSDVNKCPGSDPYVFF